MYAVSGPTIGIDATNLRAGGGVTHLVELLRAADPKAHGFERIVVWGGRKSLDLVEERPWLEKRMPPALNKGILQRTFWQISQLSRAARDEGCNVLFVPGGSFAGNFQPVVVMSQNLLPFDMPELRRYGWSYLKFKLLLLRLAQSRSFRKANGVIFLTEHARSKVLGIIGSISGLVSIIPHGLSSRFNRAPKFQHSISEYDLNRPYRIIYVSAIDQYKHQWHVAKAVSLLREQGFPVQLDLIGPAYLPALKRLNAEIDVVDPSRNWLRYHGSIAFDALHRQYLHADLGLFASTCENLPITLLETMASGLPIVCSNKAPMLGILCKSGVYFDPEKPESIANALLKLIKSATLRTTLARSSYSLSQKYSWQRCADETFGFLREVIQGNNGK